MADRQNGKRDSRVPPAVVKSYGSLPCQKCGSALQAPVDVGPADQAVYVACCTKCAMAYTLRADKGGRPTLVLALMY